MTDRYTNRIGARRPSRGPAFDPERPAPGCYRVVQRRGAPASALRIFLGNGLDPDTGEPMQERPLLWQAELNGGRVDVFHWWPACAREPISQAEHDRLVSRNATMDEESPFFDVRRPVDLNNAPPPF